MKKSIFKIVLGINIVALAILGYVWWVNGSEDTLMYSIFALIVLSSFLYIKPWKKEDI